MSINIIPTNTLSFTYYRHFNLAICTLSANIMFGTLICNSAFAGNSAANNVSNSATNPTSANNKDNVESVLHAPKDNVPTAIEDARRIQQSSIQQPHKGLPNYDVAQLLDDPKLFSYYLNQVISARDLDKLQVLLPHYKNMAGHDPLLVQFAEALLYDLEGEHKQSIKIYKSMLATDPNFHPVRLNLALSLMRDKQYKNAKSQLIKLKAENLPPQVLAIVESTLKQIQTREEWKFNASVNYLHDKNINNAPSKKMSSKFGSTTDPIEAHGVHAYAGAYKRFNLDDNFYGSISANANGNYYWDQDGYNDYTLTGATAIGYMNAHSDIAVSPFIRKRIYDDHAYSSKYGVNLTASRWIDPKVRLSGIAQYNLEYHDNKKDKNRDSHNYLLGLNGFYTQNASQYFFGGLAHYRSHAKDSPIISYHSDSVHLGWGKEWQKGISSQVTARYSQKDYDKPIGDASFYYASVGGEVGSSRKDRTTSLTTELWKRNYDIIGLTPKLIINYSQTNSNFLYYDDKQSLSGTIELSTDF